jgi:hypothetical protein
LGAFLALRAKNRAFRPAIPCEERFYLNIIQEIKKNKNICGKSSYSQFNYSYLLPGKKLKKSD